MINLLPNEEKNGIRRERALRAAGLSLFSLFFASLAWLLFLAPSFLASNAKYDILNAQMEEIKRSKVFEVSRDISFSVGDINKKLRSFSPVASDFSPADDLVRPVSEAAGEKIKITAISYVKSKSSDEADIEGVALDRESLLDYLNELRTLPGFKSVDLPVSGFVKSKNIDFSAKIILGAPATE